VVLAVISYLGHAKPFYDDDDDDENVVGPTLVAMAKIGNEIWARHGDPVAYRLVLYLFAKAEDRYRHTGCAQTYRVVQKATKFVH